RSRGADQHDFVLEAAGWSAILQHVGERDVLKARLAIAVGNERSGIVIDGNLEGTYFERFELPALEARLHGGHCAERSGEQRAKDGERQRFVVLALVFENERHAPQHAVAVQKGVDMARGGRVLDVRWQVSGIALPFV